MTASGPVDLYRFVGRAVVDHFSFRVEPCPRCGATRDMSKLSGIFKVRGSMVSIQAISCRSCWKRVSYYIDRL